MDCRILEIEETDGLITAAKYRCWIGNVETEGWWYFKNGELKTPFEKVQEADVIVWLMDQAGAGIQANLERQAQELNKPKAVAPWLPQTFKPEL
jgi:hypothetical protein